MAETLKFQRKKPLTIAVKGLCGAGEGNRTLDVSLGSSSFAIKLHPHFITPIQYTADAVFCQSVFSFATVSIAMPASMAIVPPISVGWKLWLRRSTDAATQVNDNEKNDENGGHTNRHQHQCNVQILHK